MPAGTPSYTFPDRRATCEDFPEEEQGTEHHNIGSHGQDEALADILRLEPRAIDLLGADLLNSILRAGRDNTGAPRSTGNGRLNPHPTASAAGPGLSLRDRLRNAEERMLSRGSSAFLGTAPAVPGNYGSGSTYITPRPSTVVQTARNDQGPTATLNVTANGNSTGTINYPPGLGRPSNHRVISSRVTAQPSNLNDFNAPHVPAGLTNNNNLPPFVLGLPSNTVIYPDAIAQPSNNDFTALYATFPHLLRPANITPISSPVIAQPSNNTPAAPHAPASFSNNDNILLRVLGPPSDSVHPRVVARRRNDAIAAAHVPAGLTNNTSILTPVLGQPRNTIHPGVIARPSSNIPVVPHVPAWRMKSATAGPSADTTVARSVPAGPVTLPSNYLGDTRIADNYSANIDPRQSTCLYIKELPKDVTISEILARIRGIGKIYALYINPASAGHNGCAAKITFFSRVSAEIFFNLSRGGFLVKGQRADVAWNRILVPEHVGGFWDYDSRVVIVKGPSGIVNMAAVASIVNREVRYYDLDKVYEEYGPNGTCEVEVHFGSFRAQAQSAHIVLRRAFRGTEGVEVSYGVDPCA